MHHEDLTPIFPILPFHLAGLITLALLLCSCAKLPIDQADINRDAASRCVQNIDAWKKDLARLEDLEEKFDLISDQIRHDYAKAAPDEKLRMRRRLGNTIQQM